MPKFRIKWEETTTEIWECEADDADHATEVYNDGELIDEGCRDAGVVSVEELVEHRTVYCTVRYELDTGDFYLFEGIFSTEQEAKDHCQEILEGEHEGEEPCVVLEWTDKCMTHGYLLAVTDNEIFRIFKRGVTL